MASAMAGASLYLSDIAELEPRSLTLTLSLALTLTPNLTLTLSRSDIATPRNRAQTTAPLLQVGCG